MIELPAAKLSFVEVCLVSTFACASFPALDLDLLPSPSSSSSLVLGADDDGAPPPVGRDGAPPPVGRDSTTRFGIGKRVAGSNAGPITMSCVLTSLAIYLYVGLPKPLG